MNELLFYNNLYNALEKILEPEGLQLEPVEIDFDGHIMRAINFKSKGRGFPMTVYPENYFSDFQNGMSFKEITDHVTELVVERWRHSIRYAVSNLSKDEVLSNIRTEIVNYENNKTWLAEVPHERIEDLALLAKVDLEYGNGMGVTNQLISALKLTKEEVLSRAKANTAKMAKIESFRDAFVKTMVIDGFDEKAAEDVVSLADVSQFVVLGTERGIGGAAVIGDPSILRQVYETLGEDFYIMPSSTHEVLVVAKSAYDSVDELRDMIRHANENEVPPAFRLSDNVYECNGHSIKIAGVGGLQQEHSLTNTISHHRSR